MFTRHTDSVVYVNPQSQSRLFCSPLEICQQIYSYLIPHGIHASIQRGNLSISLCVQSNPSRSIYWDDRCMLNGNRLSIDDPIRHRRLQSTWGPHWECEEIAMKTNHSPEELRSMDLTFLRTCRRAYSDLLNYSSSVETIHVTNLATIACLLGLTPTNPLNSPTIPMYMAMAFSEIRNLSITLRLPLKSFREIESFSTQSSQGSLSGAPAWLRLCPALKRFKHLQKLELWVDHSQPKTWTLVNERVFLEPLDTLLEALPGLKIIVNLPKLHPHFESPERHFVPDCPPPRAAFTIKRRVRFRDFVLGRGTDTYTEFYHDFPILFEDSEDDDLEAVEEYERKEWKLGHDVEKKKRGGRPLMQVYREITPWPTSPVVSDEEEDEEDAGSYIEY